LLRMLHFLLGHFYTTPTVTVTALNNIYHIIHKLELQNVGDS
jgi:hypothetical protein